MNSRTEKSLWKICTRTSKNPDQVFQCYHVIAASLQAAMQKIKPQMLNEEAFLSIQHVADIDIE